jgi:formiminotetrahydrofolate cyclodeaminase
MYTVLPLHDFLDALASKESVPGGGSAAALGGSLAAALVSMVCNLTLGKKGYEAVEGPMADLLRESEALRAELPQLLEADTQVYGQVMAAYRLPRVTAEEKAARQEAYQAALKAAAEVPLTIAERCGRIVELAMPAAEMGNTWAVSDAGVAVLLADACMRAALLNVYINLASIKDESFVAAMRARLARLTAGKADLAERVMARVDQVVGA